MIVDEQTYLKHYGVKGMKWGIRKDRRSSGGGKRAARPKKSSTAGLAPEYTAPAIYGASIVAGILARKVVLYRDSGVREAKQTGDTAFKTNSSLKAKMPVSKLHANVVKPINPGYGEKGTKMNCRRATLAYEMRRRGYDVKATRSVHASGQHSKGLKKAIGVDKSTKFESEWGEKLIANDKKFLVGTPQKKAQDVFSALAQNPNGARGELGLAWVLGGGHSMAWEIVNNKPVIFDTQNGKTYATPKQFSSFTPLMFKAGQTRLDNKPINDEFIKRWVTNA